MIKCFFPWNGWIIFCRLNTIKEYWKRGISNSFQKNCTKNFSCGVSFHLHNEALFEKRFRELNLLIQNSSQQDYLPELYPLYPSSYQKFLLPWCCFVASRGVKCHPIPLNLCAKLSGWKGRESHPTVINLLIFPIRKIPPNKFTFSSIKSVIPSPSNSSFHVITL